MARATGFQIYVCRPDADGKPAWTLKAPEAELFDEQGKSIGKHFGGPTWQLNDGSQITGKMAAKADAPDPKAIPWLLVTVTGHSGSGKLSGVTSIQRVNTVGGLATGGSRNAQRRAGKWSSRAVIPRTITFTRGGNPVKHRHPEPRERRRAVISTGVGVRELLFCHQEKAQGPSRLYSHNDRKLVLAHDSRDDETVAVADVQVKC